MFLADLSMRYPLLRGKKPLLLLSVIGMALALGVMAPRQPLLAIGAEIGWRHVEVTLVGVGTQVLSRVRREYAFPDAGTVFAELAATGRRGAHQARRGRGRRRTARFPPSSAPS